MSAIYKTTPNPWDYRFPKLASMQVQDSHNSGLISQHKPQTIFLQTAEWRIDFENFKFYVK